MSAAVMHVAGARPNFPKLAPVHAALTRRGIPQVLLHTGQHYDDRMSEVFFTELRLPRPDINLQVGSDTHARQTAAIMIGLEEHLSALQPSLVLVYGDVNSTLAAAVVAAKLRTPIGHVEAGLRSFDRTMPEEVNRVLTDQVSDLLFATSPEAVDHLRAEGVPADRIHFVGNPMIDTLLAHISRMDPAAVRAPLLGALGVAEPYLLATLHRPANVDDPDAARASVATLHALADRAPVVLPLHPRGRVSLAAQGLHDHPGIHVIEPLGYTDFIALLAGARAVITDSGGVQEEATMLRTACLTLRPNTERPVTVTHGTNRLVTPENVTAALDAVLASPPTPAGPPLWDGHAGERIAAIVERWLGSPPTERRR